MGSLSRLLFPVVLMLTFLATACADVQPSPPIGCANNFDCDPADYCVAETCGGPGTCLARPTDCSPNVSFVCGCDSVTYDNACQASQAGARIASLGECACDTNQDCNETDYCDGESCDGPGTCEARSTECPAVFDPVCGCDGDTYDSECLAESMGVRIDSAGPCPCAPDAVDCCDDNDDCLATEYCAAEICAGPGTCLPRPPVCVLILDPVCGCDGATHSNECVAQANGVRVDFPGECP